MTTYPLSIVDIPSADVAPEGADRSRVRRELVRRAFSRRAIIKGAFIAASASALATVDGLLKWTAASAVPPTWYRCQDYVGSSWDNGLWTVCNPEANDVDGNAVEIGSGFCASGYHRNDQYLRPEGYIVNFERRPYSCKDKNAWVWHIADNPATPNPADKRCSDGKYRAEWSSGVSGWHYSVCRVYL